MTNRVLEELCFLKVSHTIILTLKIVLFTDEEESEPKLKYERLSPDLKNILAKVGFIKRLFLR